MRITTIKVLLVRVAIFVSGISFVLPAFAGEGFIRAGKLKVYYQDKGGGEALVFLHAGGLDHRMWASQIDFFKRKYRVICIDQPGHGKTSGSDEQLQQQDVLRIVLDSLHVSTASFIGISLGAVCATDFALKYPDRTARLVLVSPGLNGWWEAFKPDSLSRRLLEHQLKVDSAAVPAARAKEMLALWCVGPFRKENEVNAKMRHTVYETMLTNFSYGSRSAPVWNPNRSVHQLDKIKAPILIIGGKLDLPLTNAIIVYIRDHTPDPEIISFPKAAHLLSLEYPAEFNSALERFLTGTKAARH